MYVTVVLFRISGKYYTEEQWEVPEDAIGPWDMVNSTDFRRISGGHVLIPDQEPWGYPCILPATIQDTVTEMQNTLDSVINERNRYQEQVQTFIRRGL